MPPQQERDGTVTRVLHSYGGAGSNNGAAGGAAGSNNGADGEQQSQQQQQQGGGGGGDESINLVNEIHHPDTMPPPMEPVRNPSVLRRESFLEEFAHSNGPPQIVLLVMMLALGFGSTIGVIPAVMTDRYARLYHGYDDIKDCSEYNNSGDDAESKPQACYDGSADAQSAVAVERLISNMFTFFTSSLIGSLSDEHGRKGVLLIGVFLSCLSPLSLVLLQLIPTMTPHYYYVAGAITGLVNWTAVALSSLSDVMPPKWRAPSFGLLLAGFSLGFALAPQLALLLGHFRVSVFSLTLVVMGLFMTLIWYPETLPPEEAAKATEMRLAQVDNMATPSERVLWNIKRPLWELMILNRNRLFRLLSLLAFFSGMVSSGDQTLLLYYLEERLGFGDQDVAIMFLIMGVMGIFVQGVVLKLINDAIGERWVVTLCFCLGSFNNLLYGLAKNKTTVYVAIAISSFGAMAFPTISAIKANNVERSEQGRIQGALYSLSALASGLGPMVMRFVYHYTKDGAFLGPGSMFVVAAMLYLVAVYAAYLLPTEANSNSKRRRNSSSFPGDEQGGGEDEEEPTEFSTTTERCPDLERSPSPSTPLL